ncbi:hypothetical protein CARUB_v10024237mg [Capsella rubella]|uniref:Senescence regulator S40 n=1 Tax=Capsella rubella TaxID=81985 RepID=R0HEN3_9BRAS|nr:uncharacterized protein LOC17888960 [Capsella rubella]EOA28059.1 hypothetical protein CARUB_v10024237mg [Capsella rubella]
MATSKCYYQRPSHRFFTNDQHVITTTAPSDFELDEWDLYNTTTGSDSSPSFTFSDLTITSGRTKTNRKAAASSLPVNVPDWSKILGEESKRQSHEEEEEEEEEEEGCARRVPPHELIANRRMASFSVHEGAGRTLKGRDLSRVRNTIFKIRGIED